MKRVLLVPDVKGWAWWHIAKGIQKYAPADYEVTVIDNSEYHHYTKERMQELADFDGVCQFSWVEATLRSSRKPLPIKHLSTLVASHGIEYSYPPDDSSYEQLIVTKLRNRERALSRLHQFDTVICVNRNLHKLAAEMDGVNAVHLLPGIDPYKYFPIRTRVPSTGRLRVGWCGQRPTGDRNNTKGHREILVPLRELAKDRFEWCINDRTASESLSQNAMNEWYNGLDVFISTSCSEGCQMPVMEAMAAGVQVIATRVGAVDEVVRDGIDGFIVSRYHNQESAKFVVADLFASLAIFNERKKSLVNFIDSRKRIMNEFTWKDRAKTWLDAMTGEA